MEEYLGMVKLFAGTYIPVGYMQCDGLEITLTTEWYPLYSIIGNTYGGRVGYTFNLPKLESPLPGTTYVICIKGGYPSRD